MLLVCRCTLSVIVLVLASAGAMAQQEIVKSYLQAGLDALNEGHYSKSETLFRAALTEIDTASLTQDNKMSATLVALNGLGLALSNQGKDAEAEAVTRRQIALMEQTNRANNSEYAIALNNLGLMLANQRKLAEALEVHRKALSIREKLLGSSHPDVAFSLLNLGKVYFDDEKFEQAEAVLQRAVSILGAIPTESQTDENMLALATCDMNLSSIKVRQGKLKEAEEFLLITLLLRTKIQGSTHPDLVEPLRNYAILLRQMNRVSDANVIEARLKKIVSQK
jgi:tetratricopeptide (TPR) repeat protein